MACLYDMNELRLPFDQVRLRGEFLSKIGESEEFYGKTVKYEEPKGKLISNHNFFLLRTCKSCRADWMDAIKTWFTSIHWKYDVLEEESLNKQDQSWRDKAKEARKERDENKFEADRLKKLNEEMIESMRSLENEKTALEEVIKRQKQDILQVHKQSNTYDSQNALRWASGFVSLRCAVSSALTDLENQNIGAAKHELKNGYERVKDL